MLQIPFTIHIAGEPAFIFIYFQLQSTYLQTIYGTYATDKTILYLHKTILTDLQCEILTLLTILSSTYKTIYIRYKNQKKGGGGGGGGGGV